jgi:hypothetical protein
VAELERAAMKKWFASAVMAFTLIIPRTGTAQGCALCNTQAEGSGPKMIQALRDGIVILMIPPLGVCLMIMAIAYKKRNRSFTPEDPAIHGSPHSDLGW